MANLTVTLATIAAMVFTWSAHKAIANRRKHGVSFEEAVTALQGWRHGASDGHMKKLRQSDMRAEYDFSKGVRGKYVPRLSQGSNVVVLDADVAALYPDSKSVSVALRKLAGLQTRYKRVTRSRPKKAQQSR